MVEKIFAISSIINVLLYMIKPTIASIFTFIILSYIFFKVKENICIKFILMIIYSCAFFNFDIFGRSGILSYMNIIIMIYIFNAFLRIVKSKYKLNIHLIITTMFLIIGVLISFTVSIDFRQSFRNMNSLILLGLVILVTEVYKRYGIVPQKKIELIAESYINVCVAISIGVIFQYVMYNIFGIELGQIFEYKYRTIFNLYFIPKSMLSAFICSGLVILFINYFDKVLLSNIFKIMILLIACTINTARTGLVAFAIIIIIYFVINIRKVLSNTKLVILIISISILAMYFVNKLLLLRGGIGDLFDANGRISLIINSIEVFKNNIFLGVGSTLEDLVLNGLTMEPHMMVLQYLNQMGILGSIPVFYMLTYILNKYKKSKYILLLIYTYLISFFYAFWNNSMFIIVCFIIVILSEESKYVRKIV